MGSGTAVSDPERYRGRNFDCVDAMIEQSTPEEWRGTCKNLATKYIWRDEGDEDLGKAIDYLRWAVGDDPRTDRRQDAEPYVPLVGEVVETRAYPVRRGRVASMDRSAYVADPYLKVEDDVTGGLFSASASSVRPVGDLPGTRIVRFREGDAVERQDD